MKSRQRRRTRTRDAIVIIKSTIVLCCLIAITWEHARTKRNKNKAENWNPDVLEYRGYGNSLGK